MSGRLGAAKLRGWSVAAFLAVCLISNAAWAQGQCPPKAQVAPENQDVEEGVEVTLNANPSQARNPSYLWTVVSGPGPIVFSPSATDVKPSFIAPDVDGDQQLVIELRVTGCTPLASSTVTTTITIRDDDAPPANTAPTAHAIATPPIAGEDVIVTLDGSGSSDPENDPLIYAWQQVGGPSVLLANASAAQASFTAPDTLADTTLEFQLTVSDPGGLTSSTNVVVNIVFANDSPFAALSCPGEVNEGQMVTLDGSASGDYEDDLAGTGPAYAWSQLLGPPTIESVLTATADTVQFVAPVLGTGQSGGIEFELTVTDGAGAFATASCGVFINDITKPVFANDHDRIVEATGPDGANVDYGLTATDNVDGDLTFAITCTPASGSAFDLDASTTVDCSVSDSAGNPATTDFKVEVRDTTAPVIDDANAVAVEATGPTTIVSYDDVETFDVVDVALKATCLPASGTAFTVGSHTVTCTAEDFSGNVATPKTFQLTVHDFTPPEVVVPTSTIIVEATSSAGAAVPFAVSASDIVSGVLTPVCKVGVDVVESNDTFALGSSTVVCTATDDAGNVGSGQFEIRVVDTTAPVIASHPNITGVEATGPSGASVAYDAPPWTDAVDGSGSASCVPMSGSTFALGTTTVTCSKTDNAGNVATPVTFTIQVVDTTAPVIAPHSNITPVEATGPSGASVVYVAPLWTDAVDGSGSASCAPLSGSTFALGTTTVTCNKTDAAGNAATPVTFTIEVVDTTPPSLTSLPNLVLDAVSGSGAVGTWTNPTATDLVSGTLPASAVSCSPASGSMFYAGPDTKVTCSATDVAGNTGTTSFMVHVRYVFSGFFRPVDNLPTTNTVKAGQAIPVKFSLGGNQGLSIFEAAYPKSVAMNCAFETVDAIEETVTAGGSTLQYDATAGQYIYVWKTDKAWAGTCRQLQVKYKDGSTQVANFNFTR